MAIAKAECTCKTCGQTFEVRAYKYNSREARSFEAWAVENIVECDDCAKARKDAEHAEENAKAAQSAKENEYPELQGTEKQVAWANTIREKAMASLREYYARQSGDAYTYQEQAVIRVALGHVKASWWIDHRAAVCGGMMSLMNALFASDEETYDHIKETCEAIENGEMTLAEAMAEFGSEKEEPRQEEKPVRPEAVPETRKHEGSVDIRVQDGVVYAQYDKDETFRSVVKGMEFYWQDGWKRPVNEITGTADNIVAELGSRLLNKGFAVRFDSRELMDRAVRGEYEPMRHRWVGCRGEDFYILWGSDEGHYYQAKSIPGARYERPGVLVPERSWKAVDDFARMYGYSLTAKAQEKMDRLSGASAKVSPAEVKEPAYNETNVLDSSREILPDLKDE